MIQIRDLEMGFGLKTLYKGVNLFIDKRDRIGLTGPNGSGKSTLLKLIKGLIQPEEGKIEIKKGLKIAYLPQSGVILNNRTVLDETLSVFKPLFEEEEHIERDRYTIESKAKEVLSRLGFSTEEFLKSTSSQSGGYQMRIALAKILLEEPDLILLDEPTNYLDIKSIEWFESYLRNFKGTFILIAHDRYLLDTCIEKVWGIENGSIVVYKGNYSAFLKEKEQREILLEKRYKEQQREIQRKKRFIERFRAKARMASRAKSKEKMLEKMERITLPKKHKSICFRFPEAPTIYGKAIELKNISKSFGKKRIFGDVDILIKGGEKIGLFGANGEGKTTLLRIIAGELKSCSGKIWRSEKLKIAFYTQGSEDRLDENKTLIEEMEEVAEGITSQEIRDTLGAFLFSGDEIYKQIRVLSGGERTRLAIIKVLLKPSTLLLLDEPANHLDIESRMILERAIKSYKNTAIFASHDRFMIDRLADKTIKIENGEVILYPGNYSYSLQKIIEPEPLKSEVTKKAAIPKNSIKEKEKRLKKLEREYEEAKKRLNLQKARELYLEYKTLLEEIEGLKNLDL